MYTACRCFALAAGFVLPWVATAAHHEKPPAWDQARVAEIAAKLPETTERLYTAAYEQGAGGLQMGPGDSHHEFRDNARLLHSESMHLAAALKKGGGRDETKHAFQRIAEINRDLIEFGRRTFQTNPILNEFAAVEDLIRQLAPYYSAHVDD
jgi:hypothetical protein